MLGRDILVPDRLEINICHTNKRTVNVESFSSCSSCILSGSRSSDRHGIEKLKQLPDWPFSSF